VAQAAVQDAHEAVAQGAEGLVVAAIRRTLPDPRVRRLRREGPCRKAIRRSRTTWAMSESRSICRFPSAEVRSTVTDFLPRLLGRKYVANGGRSGRTEVICRAPPP
jgi:hypothetical protein